MIKKTSERPTRSMRTFRRTLVEICKDCSINEVALKDLCEKAGFTAMAFYYCYDDKYDLAKDIIDSEIINLKKIGVSSVNKAISADYRKEYALSTEKLFEYLGQNRDLYSCIFDNKLMPDTINYIIDDMVSWFRENMHFEGISNDIDESYIELMIRIRYTEILTIVKYWIERECDISPKRIAEMTMELLCLGEDRIVTG